MKGQTTTKNKKTGRNASGSLFGGARRDRTAGLYNAIVALSQLSYGPNLHHYRQQFVAPVEGGAFRHSMDALSI